MNMSYTKHDAKKPLIFIFFFIINSLVMTAWARDSTAILRPPVIAVKTVPVADLSNCVTLPQQEYIHINLDDAGDNWSPYNTFQCPAGMLLQQVVSRSSVQTSLSGVHSLHNSLTPVCCPSINEWHDV